MVNTVDNTILLKTALQVIQSENTAAGTITPGEFVEITSSDECQRQSTAGADAAKQIALEYSLYGRGIDDDYAIGDNVLLANVRSGDIVNALVAAGASAIVVGDSLEFDGNGGLALVTTGKPVAVANVAVDNSGGGSKARIQARII
jgi:type II secretory pathway component HofQ